MDNFVNLARNHFEIEKSCDIDVIKGEENQLSFCLYF